MKKTNKGFTLIELLVVIAIIGLLATLSVVALNNARERARDSRRVSDVKQIQTALELYYNANPTIGYPATLAVLVTENLMDPIPTPPTPDDCTGNTYAYTVAGDGDSYCLQYCLSGNTGGIDAGDNIHATQSTIDGPRGTCTP